MANNAININKIMFVPDPSRYLGFQHYMSWSLLWSVVLRSGVVVFLFFCCCWYWWNCWPSWLKLSFHNHISHRIVEYKQDNWLNISCFVSYNIWHRIVEYKKDYWLIIFMFCNLQHGILQRIWYLQFSKGCQVVELYWCILITFQITTKYKIRTKYNDNLRPNKHR